MAQQAHKRLSKTALNFMRWLRDHEHDSICYWHKMGETIIIFKGIGRNGKKTQRQTLQKYWIEASPYLELAPNRTNRMYRPNSKGMRFLREADMGVRPHKQYTLGFPTDKQKERQQHDRT